ncbi:MAG: transporter substrate-binding domain-containing protein [Tannerella sp.]|jgi:membrane-bound lytic murein transglycosylase MltF|nr:transporter substrate-binding domain-containing protein [Tannerella sp.]
MKRKLILYLYIAILIAVIATMYSLRRSAGSSTDRDYDAIHAEGVLNVVTEYNRHGFFVSGDTTEGFQYELIRAISTVSGLEVHLFLEMSLAESFKGLDNGKYDLIACNVPVTTELREDYLFTDPVVFNKQVLVQRTAAANNAVPPVRNQLELAGKTLHIPQNSPSMLRLQNLQHEIGDTIYVLEDALYSAEQLIIMVAKGDIDFAVCDRRIASIAMKQFPEIDIGTDIGFMQLQSWAVRKQSVALRDSINSWFDRIRSAGAFNDIYKRYYNP